MEMAYLLIQCDMGAEIDIIKKLTKIPEVKEVRGTYGVYDIFAKLESETREQLDEILTNNIRRFQKFVQLTRFLRYYPKAESNFIL